MKIKIDELYTDGLEVVRVLYAVRGEVYVEHHGGTRSYMPAIDFVEHWKEVYR